MARIRTIKPDFFRHEELQKLGPLPMLVFVGLWTQADKAGNFPWRPSQLKLDILPFVDYDLGTSMEVLRNAGFLLRYTGDDQKEYGHIPNFRDHQRFFGTEVKANPRFPSYFGDVGAKDAKRKFHGSAMEGGNQESGIRNQESGVRRNGVAAGESMESLKVRIAGKKPQASVIPPMPEGIDDEEPPAQKPKKPSRRDRARLPVPQDWRPSDATMAWAKEQGFTTEQVEQMLREFIFYWQGEGKGKADWDATFKNRIVFVQGNAQVTQKFNGRSVTNGVHSKAPVLKERE